MSASSGRPFVYKDQLAEPAWWRGYRCGRGYLASIKCETMQQSGKKPHTVQKRHSTDISGRNLLPTEGAQPAAVYVKNNAVQGFMVKVVHIREYVPPGTAL